MPIVKAAKGQSVIKSSFASPEAIAHIKTQKYGMDCYPPDRRAKCLKAFPKGFEGRLKISDNLSERSIMLFLIGRKNFLLANTPRDTTASVVMYSLIEKDKRMAWTLSTIWFMFPERSQFEYSQ